MLRLVAGQAETLWDEALPIDLGHQHPELAPIINTPSLASQADGDSAEAMRLLACTAAWLQRAVNPQHPTLLACRHNLQADAVDTPFDPKSGGRDACPSRSVPLLWKRSTLRHAQPGPGTSLLHARWASVSAQMPETPAPDEQQKRDGAAMDAGAGSCPVIKRHPDHPDPAQPRPILNVAECTAAVATPRWSRSSSPI